LKYMNLAAPCGIYCGDCEHIGQKCPGCEQVEGKPYWTKQYRVEVCPLYDCCSNKKELEHCGLCTDFPCETFSSLRDPSLTNEDAEQALAQRKRELQLRKEIGTEGWLRERR